MVGNKLQNSILKRGGGGLIDMDCNPFFNLCNQLRVSREQYDATYCGYGVFASGQS